MTEAVVVDASLAVKWAIPEPYSERALELAEGWAGVGTRLLAPCLLIAEVTNALYKRIARGELDLATAEGALEIILAFSIELREEPGLPARAMALAQEFRRSTTYDCHYLALAERYDCELWTGDRRLYNAVRAALRRVKCVESD
jgi:predicted nucleic acid-binding protein